MLALLMIDMIDKIGWDDAFYIKMRYDEQLFKEMEAVDERT